MLLLVGEGGLGGTNVLQGAGGAIDYSTRFVSPILLQVEAALCDSAVQITGTAQGLDAWLWGRLPGSAVERTGDAAALDAFGAVIGPGID